VSYLATTEHSGTPAKRLMLCDVSRAFFFAPIEDTIFVELPEEDREEGKDEVAKLNFSLYGTRQAAAHWRGTYSKHLVSIGSLQGKTTPCLFYHFKTQIRALVHGDDYVAVAHPEDFKWPQKQIGNAFEIRTKVLGPDEAEGEEREISVLGRISNGGKKG
jgi:hypothetical protein